MTVPLSPLSPMATTAAPVGLAKSRLAATSVGSPACVSNMSRNPLASIGKGTAWPTKRAAFSNNRSTEPMEIDPSRYPRAAAAGMSATGGPEGIAAATATAPALAARPAEAGWGGGVLAAQAETDTMAIKPTHAANRSPMAEKIPALRSAH